MRAGTSLNRIVRLSLLAAALVFAGAHARAAEPADLAKLHEQLRAAETAFAKTMADRDLAAFTAFLADEAVFFGREELRGKDAVAAAWARFYEGKDAPFSWRPETASVLASGHLGFTSGPVFDPAGRQIGTFNSVWRREPGGAWKIVFDKGCPPCATE